MICVFNNVTMTDMKIIILWKHTINHAIYIETPPWFITYNGCRIRKMWKVLNSFLQWCRIWNASKRYYELIFLMVLIMHIFVINFWYLPFLFHCQATGCCILLNPLSTTGLLTPFLIGSYHELFTCLANHYKALKM